MFFFLPRPTWALSGAACSCSGLRPLRPQRAPGVLRAAAGSSRSLAVHTVLHWYTATLRAESVYTCKLARSSSAPHRRSLLSASTTHGMQPDPSVSMMRQIVETHRSDKNALERLYTISFS